MSEIVNIVTLNQQAQVVLTDQDNLTVVMQQDNQIVNMIGNPVAVGAGGSGDYLNFSQSTPATVWTISHNFGKKPNISTYTSGGLEMWGEVLHTSANVVQVSFDSAVSGFAILS